MTLQACEILAYAKTGLGLAMNNEEYFWVKKNQNGSNMPKQAYKRYCLIKENMTGNHSLKINIRSKGKQCKFRALSQVKHNQNSEVTSCSKINKYQKYKFHGSNIIQVLKQSERTEI